MAGISSYEERFSKGRTIGGVRYKLSQFIEDKEEAEEFVKLLRSHGIKAKVVPTKSKFETMHNVYVPIGDYNKVSQYIF